MTYLARWKKISSRNWPLKFFDATLKGYGQVLICLNPVTGLMLSAVIFYFSAAIGSLALIGVVFATWAAYCVRARPFHIHSGVYGFNGAVLGVAWLWFFRLNVISILLFAAAAALSSLALKALISFNSRRKTNLPVFSVPALVLLWTALILLKCPAFYTVIGGPDQRIVDYWRELRGSVSVMEYHFTPGLFIAQFHKQIIGISVIFLGIMAHSRLAAYFAAGAFFITAALVYLLGGVKEFLNLEFYLYNTIPCAMALGGTFLVLNRNVSLLALLGVIISTLLVFFGMPSLPIPIFVAPFNLLAIALIWLVKSGILRAKWGFLAVPMEFVSTPEFGLEWLKGEIYADKYWRDINKTLPDLQCHSRPALLSSPRKRGSINGGVNSSGNPKS